MSQADAKGQEKDSCQECSLDTEAFPIQSNRSGNTVDAFRLTLVNEGKACEYPSGNTNLAGLKAPDH